MSTATTIRALPTMMRIGVVEAIIQQAVSVQVQ